ncbi:MFS transporter [Lachnospiraceae bacterium 48-42]
MCVTCCRGVYLLILETASYIFILLFFVKLNIHQHGVVLLVVLLLTYIASAVIYPSGEKLIPLLVSDDELLHTNGLFHTSEKVLDVAFNVVSAFMISFFREDVIVLLIIIFFLLAARFHRIVAYYYESMQRDNFSGYKKERYSIPKYVEELKTGIREIKKHTEIILLFFPLSIINMFYGIAMVGLPKVAEVYISDMAYGYGSLLMSASLGGILGSCLICKFPKSVYAPKKYSKIFLFIAGSAWLIMSIIIKYNFLFAFLFIFISNCGINMMNVMFTSIIQKEIDASLLGRVSTFTESLVSIIIPLGNLMGGVVLVLLNPLLSQILYGIVMILCGMLIFPNRIR